MNAAHVYLIARTDLVRRWRAVRSNTRQFAGVVIAAVFGLIWVVAVAATAFFFGQGIASGAVDDPMSLARPAAGAVVAGLTVLVTIRVVQQGAEPAHPEGLLTTVPHVEAVLGVVLSELTVSAGLLAIPGVLAAVTFAVGAGSPASGLLLLASLAGLLALGGLLGFAVGLAVGNVFARSRLLARYKTAIGVLLLLAYFGVVFSQSADNVAAPVVDGLAATPFGWFADLALYALVDTSPVRAGAAVGIAVVGVAALVVACSRLAAALWYTEPAQPTERTERASGMGGVSGLPRPTARIVRKTWLRARRNPIRLIYVIYPIFLIYAPVAESVQSGTVPALLPPLVALYGAWSTGAAFTLNPVGDEGPVLPVTLTTPVSGREFVGGLCLAALLVGLPITVALVVVTGLLSPLDLPATLAVAASAAALCVAGTGIGAGAGTLFPRLEAVRVTRSREAVVPSLFAFSVYSLVVGVVGLPATAVGAPAGRDLLADLTGLAPDAVTAGAVALTAVAGLVAAAVGFRYAARGFDEFYYG
jgi:hypothetical protein